MWIVAKNFAVNAVKRANTTAPLRAFSSPPTWLNGVDMDAFKSTLEESSAATSAPAPKESVITTCSLATTSTPSSDEETPESLVNKFFKASKQHLESVLPEGTSKAFIETISNNPKTGPSHWMLRKSTSEIFNRLSRFQSYNKDDKKKMSILIDGKTGVGKTVAMGQIVEYCRSQDWLVLYFSNARKWCYEGHYVEPSTADKNMFDVYGVGESVLSTFLSAHQDKLETISLVDADKYQSIFDPFQRKFTGSTLADLVSFGIEFPETSSLVLVEVRSQLNKVTSFPVLIAVDEYNWWHFDTVFGYRGNRVKPSDITVINAYADFDGQEREMANGVFIGSTTDTYKTSMDLRKSIDYSKYRSTFKNYNGKELKSALDYYEEIGFIFERNDENLMNSVHLLTNGNPHAVYHRASVL